MLTEWFVGSISPRAQAVAIIGSLLLLAAVINLIRNGKLKEGYSIIWFLIGATLVIVSTLTRLLDIVANAVGIAYTPAALFLIFITGLFLLALHFSVMVSKHDRLIRELAQENALLRAQNETTPKATDPMNTVSTPAASRRQPERVQ